MAKTFKTNQSLVNAGFNQVLGQTLSLSGNTLIGSTGTLKYSSDQSSAYVARSIVDADYVTGLTSALCNIGSVGQIIYRSSSGITGATGFTYSTSGVSISNLYISQTPVTETGDYFLLTWDSGTTKVNKMSALSVTGIQGAFNGLSVVGDCVRLGGVLSGDTTINGFNGVDSNSLRFCNLCNMCISTILNNIVLDSRCNSGGIYLKSQSGTISSPLINYNSSVGIAMDYPSNIFKIFDNRIGTNRTGIEYDANYSSNYTSRSLVDKSYVDTVASGLQPHPAVKVATTGNTALTGLTSGTTFIDGVLINQDDRVLIKNQDDARENGIYVLTGSSTTFVRSYDFNESSESVQGAYTFVLSGSSNEGTSWVLSTPNPITLGVTRLIFTQFNQVTDIIAGHGICIVNNYAQRVICVRGDELNGNSLSWNTSVCQFDVDITGGTLGTALSQTITGATNGLTKVGQDVVFGGALTGNTTICGAYALYLGCNGSCLSNLNSYTTSTQFLGGVLGSCAAGLQLDSNVAELSFFNTGSGCAPRITLYSGGTLVCNNDLKYDTNYSSTFTARSLVDKAYVTGYTQSAITNASNTVAVYNTITNYTATTTSDFIGVSGASTIYLPPVPKPCQRISIADIKGDALSSSIIICGCWGSNGQLINGSSHSTINTDYGSITFINNGISWSAVSFTN
jgi:hypothetical protein